MDQEAETNLTFALAALFHAARLANNSVIGPSAFESLGEAQQFVEQAKRQNLMPTSMP